MIGRRHSCPAVPSLAFHIERNKCSTESLIRFWNQKLARFLKEHAESKGERHKQLDDISDAYCSSCTQTIIGLQQLYDRHYEMFHEQNFKPCLRFPNVINNWSIEWRQSTENGKLLFVVRGVLACHPDVASPAETKNGSTSSTDSSCPKPREYLLTVLDKNFSMCHIATDLDSAEIFQVGLGARSQLQTVDELDETLTLNVSRTKTGDLNTKTFEICDMHFDFKTVDPYRVPKMMGGNIKISVSPHGKSCPIYGQQGRESFMYCQFCAEFMYVRGSIWSTIDSINCQEPDEGHEEEEEKAIDNETL